MNAGEFRFLAVSQCKEPDSTQIGHLLRESLADWALDRVRPSQHGVAGRTLADPYLANQLEAVSLITRAYPPPARHRWRVRGINSPHPRGDALFLFADGIGVDCRGGELGVAQPPLHQVQRNAGGDRGDAEAVPQPLG